MILRKHQLLRHGPQADAFSLVNSKLFKNWVLPSWAGHVPQMSPSAWLEGLENLAVTPLFKGPGPFLSLGILRSGVLSHHWRWGGVRPASSLAEWWGLCCGLRHGGERGTTTGPPSLGFFAKLWITVCSLLHVCCHCQHRLVMPVTLTLFGSSPGLSSPSQAGRRIWDISGCCGSPVFPTMANPSPTLNSWAPCLAQGKGVRTTRRIIQRILCFNLLSIF